jgi:hypothetical protein
LEPGIRVKAAISGFPAHPGHVAGARVVRGECDERAIQVAEVGGGEAHFHQVVRLFRAGMDTVLGDRDVAHPDLGSGGGHPLHNPDRSAMASRLAAADRESWE